MTKTIIFDFDGVIVDSLELGHESHLNFCKKIGRKIFISLDDFKSKFLQTHLELYSDFGFNEKEIQQLQSQFYHDFGMQNIHRIRPIKNIEKVLETLSKQHKLAIVSNSYRKIIENVLERHNLKKYFEYISANDDERPKSERLKEVLEMFQTKNHEAVYVGDMVHDIREGRKAGIKTVILCQHSWNHKHDLINHNPDILLDRPEQLLEEIENG